jgi:mRNA interferase MazF
VLRGDIHEVDFGPGVGREPTGLHPALIVSNDTLNVAPFALIVLPGVPTTPLSSHRSIGVQVTAAESGLTADTTFLCYRISSVDPSRVKPGPVGALPPARMADIDRILLSLLGLNTPPPPGPPAVPRP